MIHFWCFLLILLALLQTGVTFTLEEVGLTGCTGFVWKLQFQVPSLEFHNNSIRTDAGQYYALYWPEEPNHLNHSLDPHTFSQCKRGGGTQKLRSRTLTLTQEQTEGTIFLYRLRDSVPYLVTLYRILTVTRMDNVQVQEAVQLAQTTRFYPVHSDCDALLPQRNLSYGFFSFPLLRFDRSPYIYFLDQSGALVHALHAPWDVYITMLAQPLDFVNRRLWLLVKHSQNLDALLALLDAKGSTVWMKHEKCIHSFHHELFFDREEGFMYTLGNIGYPARELILDGVKICEGYAYESSNVYRIDVNHNYDVSLVLTINYTTNNTCDSLVDLFRDDLGTHFKLDGVSKGCEEMASNASYPANECHVLPAKGWEILHANSFTKAKDGSGRFVMSLRTTSQVVLFDSQFRMEQVVGGNGRNARTYTFVNKSEDEFIGQHHATIEADGTLLLFDNGGAHSEFDLPYRAFTRVMRLSLDPATMKAKSIWQFDSTRYSGLVSRCCGSATLIEPSGNVLTHTSHQNGSFQFYFFEADGRESDKPLAIYTVFPGRAYEDSWQFRLIYRSHWETSIDGESVVCDIPPRETLVPLIEPPSPWTNSQLVTLIALPICLGVMCTVRRLRANGTKLPFRPWKRM